ncbi:hypothetical protein LTR94_026819, partial [Friedmanniomyces endolithicus]
IVKIGIVLTLAGSWPAYKTVIYDVVVDGPEQFIRVISGAAALPGSTGDKALIARLQATDRAIIRLTDLGTGREPSATLPSSSGGQERYPIADDPAFGWARIAFLTSVIATFAAIRLTAGVLLALAPVFAGLLLFEVGRGLAVGWARGLVFTVIASVISAIILGVELAILEPWLTRIIQLRQGSGLAASAPVELLILSLGFAFALAGALAVAMRLSFMTHLRPAHVEAPVGDPASSSPRGYELAPGVPAARPNALAASASAYQLPPSRALAIADAVRNTQRREAQATAPAASATSRTRPSPHQTEDLSRRSATRSSQMKKASREALDAYYKEAGSWATDRIGALQSSRRIAWIVAAGAATIAVVEAVALVALTPLKTVEPYTLMVDRTTGFVQELKPLDPNQITPDKALIQSML